MHSDEERTICCRLRVQAYALMSIAMALNICKRTVQRWLKGYTTAPRPLNRIHRQKLNVKQQEQLAYFFLRNNTNTLVQGVTFVHTTFGVLVFRSQPVSFDVVC